MIFKEKNKVTFFSFSLFKFNFFFSDIFFFFFLSIFEEELEAQNIDQDVGKFCSEFTQKFESIISQLDKLKTRLQEYQNKLDSGEKVSLFDLVTDIEEVKAQIPTTPGFCTSKIQPTAKIVVDENQHAYEEEDLYMDDDDLHYSAEMTEDEEKEMFDSSEQNVEEKKEEKEEKEEEENDSPTKSKF